MATMCTGGQSLQERLAVNQGRVKQRYVAPSSLQERVVEAAARPSDESHRPDALPDVMARGHSAPLIAKGVLSVRRREAGACGSGLCSVYAFLDFDHI